MLRPKGGPQTMFDYHSELVISRMERERQIKALALAAAARPGRRSGLRAGRLSGLRAGLATALARLALAVHRDAAVGAVPQPQADAAGCRAEREAMSA
ncbi:MAG: hypothetical protein Q8Q00_02790 [Dehalococcoidia bacterium]|nr:hypothetical protein [Dehalococcoidia bacterium]